MSRKVKFAVQLRTRLDRIEHCLLLAETVANVLQSDSHLEHDSIVGLLGVEAVVALERITEVRQNLDALQRQNPACSMR